MPLKPSHWHFGNSTLLNTSTRLHERRHSHALRHAIAVYRTIFSREQPIRNPNGKAMAEIVNNSVFALIPQICPCSWTRPCLSPTAAVATSWSRRCCGIVAVRSISSSVRWRETWRKWARPSIPSPWVSPHHFLRRIFPYFPLFYRLFV